MSVSIILPVFDLGPDRAWSVDFVLKHIKRAGFDEVIIVEQIGQDGSCLTESQLRGTTHLKVCVDSSCIHKSLLINRGVMYANTDFIWMNDIDIYAPFSQAICLLNSEMEAAKPFSCFYRFTRDLSDRFVEDGFVDVQGENLIVVHQFAAGAFVIRKDVFLELRGMNEVFVGWGCEDCEFRARVEKLCKVEVFRNLKGIHLHHERIPETETRDIYERCLEEIDDDVEAYVRGMNSSIPCWGTPPQRFLVV